MNARDLPHALVAPVFVGSGQAGSETQASEDTVADGPGGYPCTVTEAHFKVRLDEESTFTFFETEDGLIAAYGHRDPEALVAEVYDYDRRMSERWATRHELSDVQHAWALAYTINEGESPDQSDWFFRAVSKSHESAQELFPITLIQR